MKVVLDVNGQPKDGDILVYNAKKAEYVPVAKKVVLDEVLKLAEKVRALESELNMLKPRVANAEGRLDILEGKD